MFERFIFLGLCREVLYIYFYASVCFTSWGNCIALNTFPGMKGPSGTHLSNYAPPSLSSGPRMNVAALNVMTDCHVMTDPAPQTSGDSRPGPAVTASSSNPPRDAGRDRGQPHREGEPLERAPKEVPPGSFCLPFKAEGRYSWPSLQLGEPWVGPEASAGLPPYLAQGQGLWTVPVEGFFEGAQPGLSDADLVLQGGLLLTLGVGIFISVEVPHPGAGQDFHGAPTEPGLPGKEKTHTSVLLSRDVGHEGPWEGLAKCLGRPERRMTLALRVEQSFLV